MDGCGLFPGYFIINEAGKRSGADPVWHFHLESVGFSFQYESQRVVMISEESWNKLIREVKIDDCWLEQSYKERACRWAQQHQKTQKTMGNNCGRWFFLVKKNPFTTVGQIKNILQEVGVCVSKSRINRRLHLSEDRGSKTYHLISEACWWWCYANGTGSLILIDDVTGHAFDLLKTELKGKCPKNKHQLKRQWRPDRASSGMKPSKL